MNDAESSHFKVLVVDDHPNTANMLARAISHIGSHVEVVSATSGYEALKHLENGAADILITDMMMPEMTGMELIETLNDKPSISPAVTFLLTAYDSAGIRETARRLHVKKVVAKPVHPERICQLVSQTMDELRQSVSADHEAASHQQAELKQNTRPLLEDLNVSQLLWEVAKKFQPQADVKNQLLVVGKTEPDSKIRGNAAQLRQALRNLVWSAINNTPEGGTVTLSSENQSNMVKIFIRDTRYGNPGNMDHEANDQELATVKSIVEQHGGQVTVKSDDVPGNGSCFVMILPLSMQAPPETICKGSSSRPLDIV